MTIDQTTGFMIIGEGAVISGNVELPGKLIVNGRLEGLVNAKEIFVGITGEITGEVHAAEADIQGRISDFVSISGKLILRATAKITGNIEYKYLEIEKGAVVEGVLSQKADLPKLQSVTYPTQAKVLNQKDFSATKA